MPEQREILSIIRRKQTVFVTTGERTWQTTCLTIGEAKVLIERIQEAPEIAAKWMKLTDFRKAPPAPVPVAKPTVRLDPQPEIEAPPDVGPGLRRILF